MKRVFEKIEMCLVHATVSFTQALDLSIIPFHVTPIFITMFKEISHIQR